MPISFAIFWCSNWSLPDSISSAWSNFVENLISLIFIYIRISIQCLNSFQFLFYFYGKFYSSCKFCDLWYFEIVLVCCKVLITRNYRKFFDFVSAILICCISKQFLCSFIPTYIEQFLYIPTIFSFVVFTSVFLVCYLFFQQWFSTLQCNLFFIIKTTVNFFLESQRPMWMNESEICFFFFDYNISRRVSSFPKIFSLHCILLKTVNSIMYILNFLSHSKPLILLLYYISILLLLFKMHFPFVVLNYLANRIVFFHK